MKDKFYIKRGMMMTNKIEQFLNEKFGEVRAIKDDKGVIWFVASDIAKVLGYRMASDMTRLLDEDERDTQTMRTSTSEQKMNIINEGGLYSVILSITKRNGERYSISREFKKWITNEVIPTIRETGAYIEEQREQEVVDKYFHGLSEDLKLQVFKELQSNNEKLKVKASNWDKFLDTTSTYTLTQVAKMISTKATEDGNNDFKVSIHALTKYLRNKGILGKAKSGGKYLNNPLQDYESYFNVVAVNINTIDRTQTRVKSSGVEFIYSKLQEDDFKLVS